jgi:hypothetical protein
VNIEHGIPPPKKRNNIRSKWLDVAEALKPGDSYVVETKGEANSLSYVIRYYGNETTFRRLNDGTYRVWKLNPPSSNGRTCGSEPQNQGSNP